MIEEHNIWFNNRDQGRRLELSEVDFSGIDLRGRRLVEAKFSRVNFSGAQFDNSILDKSEFDEVTFKNANLSGCSLNDATLTKIDFSGCRLFDASLCYLRGDDCNFSDAILEKAAMAKSVFYRMTMISGFLKDANLLRLSVYGGDIRKCVFHEADMTRAMFVDVDLRDSEFAGTTLFKTGFERAHVHGIKGPVRRIENCWAIDPDFSCEADGSDIVSEEKFFNEIT